MLNLQQIVVRQLFVKREKPETYWKDYVMIIIKNNPSKIKIKYNKTVTIVITI